MALDKSFSVGNGIHFDSQLDSLYNNNTTKR